MTLLRSASGQSAIYALVIGALFGLPGVVAVAIWGSSFDPGRSVPGVLGEVFFVAGMFFAVIALVGAIPATASAAITWCIFLRRHRGSPPLDVVPYCWIVALVGSYLLIPLWIALLSSIAKNKLRPADALAEGFGVVAVGFVLTVPYVAPVMYLGTWLWVRRIRPRLMPVGILPA